jgi:hypothetical protein
MCQLDAESHRHLLEPMGPRLLLFFNVKYPQAKGAYTLLKLVIVTIQKARSCIDKNA